MTQIIKKRDFNKLLADVKKLKAQRCCGNVSGGFEYRLTPIAGNIFSLTEDGVAVSSIDLSAYVDSARIVGVALNLATNVITFTRDDATTLTVDLSSLANNLETVVIATPLTAGVPYNYSGDLTIAGIVDVLSVTVLNSATGSEIVLDKNIVANTVEANVNYVGVTIKIIGTV